MTLTLTLTLALWQGDGARNDISATLAELARVAARANRRKAGLLVLPEGYLTGYSLPGLSPDDLAHVPAALDLVGAIAARTGVGIVLGTHVEEAGVLRNAAIVFDRSGQQVGRYFKRALFGGWEKTTFEPGAQPLRFEIGGLRVGVAICYDVEFPELIRAEALTGVGLVVVPTALMAPHDRIARQVVPVRALENQIFIGYANRCGTEPGLDFVGQSRICGPRGEVLAKAGRKEGLVVATLDPAALLRERSQGCYLDDLDALQ